MVFCYHNCSNVLWEKITETLGLKSLLQNTLCHFGTLLFSGLPMMISQKFFFVCLFWRAIEKIREIRVWRKLLKWFDRKNCFRQFCQSADLFRLIWKPNAWLDLLENNFYYNIFTLFHAGLVLFTVNDLNWSQSW